MDKKKSKYKDDYSLRTLVYYQRVGGVYNELITVLQRIRAERGNGRLRAPHVILNVASEALDNCMWLVDEDKLIFEDLGEAFYQLRRSIFGENGFFLIHVNELSDDKAIECVICTLCVLMFQIKGLDELVPLLSEHVAPELYRNFAPLIEKTEVRDQSVQVEALERQIRTMEEIMREKDSELAQLSQEISKQQEEIIAAKKSALVAYSYYETALQEFSGLNGLLTIDTILEWARGRKHYKLADQIIAMLKDLGRRTATDEELEKIESLENELLSKYSELSIVNNNMGFGSNFLTGLAQNPMMPMGITPEQLTQQFFEFINNGARRENKD